MRKAVLIADDNAFVRQRVGELFSREPDFEVCADAENGKKAVEEAQEFHPALILLDLFIRSLAIQMAQDAKTECHTDYANCTCAGGLVRS